MIDFIIEWIVALLAHVLGHLRWWVVLPILLVVALIILCCVV
jgi:hypothetical protein